MSEEEHRGWGERAANWVASLEEGTTQHKSRPKTTKPGWVKTTTTAGGWREEESKESIEVYWPETTTQPKWKPETTTPSQKKPTTTTGSRWRMLELKRTWDTEESESYDSIPSRLIEGTAKVTRKKTTTLRTETTTLGWKHKTTTSGWKGKLLYQQCYAFSAGESGLIQLM